MPEQHSPSSLKVTVYITTIKIILWNSSATTQTGYSTLQNVWPAKSSASLRQTVQKFILWSVAPGDWMQLSEGGGVL